LREQVSAIFEKKCGQQEKKNQRLADDFYNQIGRLKVENDFLAVRLKR